MSQTEIDEIISEFRKSPCGISDEETADVVRLCRRKIEASGYPDSYMKLLLPDELKNYLFRRAVNATAVLRRIGKEVMADVPVMYAEPMPSEVPECCRPKTVVLL